MRQVTLEDKYISDQDRVYLTGIQALVRLALVQRRRDVAAGLNTAGFISGYRGSPLGGLDEALWKAQKHLEAHHIKFQPGVNEELAATAVWGSQQVELIGESNYDGVFALWYGKGPGVDRCGDVFKHMNFGGTSKHGGVLLVAGDDHGAYSSTLPHQSDHLFSASMIPVLYPCNVQEYVELGLHGWAMSRFSGCAIGFKALADPVESSASIEADPFRVKPLVPADFVMPEGGLNCRLSSDLLGQQARKQEALMQDYKIYAAMAYARLNKINRTTIDSANAKLGIIASGKSYMDVLEALEELGITEENAAQIGIRLFKVSMPWPLEPKEAVLKKAVDTPVRPPYYCSGCPHNTSTKVPDGSLALAGIGCHVMATVIYPEHNKSPTHMGGEGAPWIGQAPFSKRSHIFANLGDGTYFHSGSLAIRAALAANVNITYKILYNDAVAMTGGQPVDGQISVDLIAQQMAAEGVKRIAVVTEELSRYTDRSQLPAMVTVNDRKDMEAVQRELREIQGVSVLIYDQTCAAEKRRRRKKGEYPKATQRVFINEAVCEGCGDCGVQSNCTSILPVETEFRRKA